MKKRSKPSPIALAIAALLSTEANGAPSSLIESLADDSDKNTTPRAKGFEGQPAIKRVVVRADGLMYGGNEADGITPIWRDDSASIFDLSYPTSRETAEALCVKHGAKLKRWCDATRKHRTV